MLNLTTTSPHVLPWRTPSFLCAAKFASDACQLLPPAEIKAITKHSIVYKSYSLYYNQYVAIKVIDKSSIPIPLANKFLTRELDITRMVNHPNIPRCLSVMQPNPTKIVIVTEFCAGGTLLNYVMQFGGLPEFEAFRLFHQLAKAVHYLHTTLNVAHRDIKLENVLLDSQRNLKLVDFGFARPATAITKSTSFCGTQPYSSPQLIDHVAYSPFKADWFACGVLLYTMMTGCWPREGNQKATLPLNYPFGKVSINARKLIEVLIANDEQSRFDYNGIKKSDWFVEMLASSLPSLAPTELPYAVGDGNPMYMCQQTTDPSCAYTTQMPASIQVPLSAVNGATANYNQTNNLLPPHKKQF